LSSSTSSQLVLVRRKQITAAPPAATSGVPAAALFGTANMGNPVRAVEGERAEALAEHCDSVLAVPPCWPAGL
jgi:hypothetical protein